MITVETLQTLNYFVAIGGVVSILIIAILLFDFFTKQSLKKPIQQWGALIMFAVVLFSAVMTFIYSEVFGIAPCGFCWFERVFMYPQVFLILAGIYFKDKLMPKYAIILSEAGLIIALYHHYIQMGGSEFVACPTAGTGVDCAKRVLFEFGFVTLPLLAVIAFGLIIVISVYLLKTSNSDQKEG